jgi:hypothetical protein
LATRRAGGAVLAGCCGMWLSRSRVLAMLTASLRPRRYGIVTASVTEAHTPPSAAIRLWDPLATSGLTSIRTVARARHEQSCRADRLPPGASGITGAQPHLRNGANVNGRGTRHGGTTAGPRLCCPA